jgi:hypothetical protein
VLAWFLGVVVERLVGWWWAAEVATHGVGWGGVGCVLVC